MAVTDEVTYPSKYIVCSKSYYDSLTSETIDYSALYLVNDSSEPSSEDNDHTELYYGKNRLTDLQFIDVTTSPLSTASINALPNNKLYLEIKESDDQSLSGNGTTAYDIISFKVKFNNQLMPIINLAAFYAGGDGTKYLNDAGTYTTPAGGGGGTTYGNGNGININTSDDPNTINVYLDNTKGVDFDTLNRLVLKLKSNSGLDVDSNGLFIKLKSGGGLTVDSDGLSCTGGGGGGGSYSPGDGITINGSNYISVRRKSTSSYLDFDGSGNLGVDYSSLSAALYGDTTFVSNMTTAIIPNLDDGRVN